MSDPAPPGRRALVACVVVLVAWVFAPRIVQQGFARTPPEPATSAAIAPNVVLLGMVSDRPTLPTLARRGEGPWSLFALVGTRAGVEPPASARRAPALPTTLVSAGPITFGLARRGPPDQVSV